MHKLQNCLNIINDTYKQLLQTVKTLVSYEAIIVYLQPLYAK